MSQPLAFTGARLVDPESGYDGPGALLVADGCIARASHEATFSDLPSNVKVIKANGAMLCPGLIDLRVKTGEPGSEPKETLKSAARAAAAGGVTSIVVQPDTDPVIDDPAVVDFILRRARDIELVHVYPAGAATKGCLGRGMAEIGLMREAGCVYVTDADRPIVDSRVMRRLLSYAGALGVLVSHRPADPWLTAGASATEGEFAGRMGLAAEPIAAETIMLERDIALVALTGSRLLVDQISAAAPLRSLARAKAQGLPILATASISHLSFNELDIGDYRTFCKLVPPLRGEEDRVGAYRRSGFRTGGHRRLRPRPRARRGQAPALRRGRARGDRPGDLAPRPPHSLPRRPGAPPPPHRGRDPRPGASDRAGRGADCHRRPGGPHSLRHRRAETDRRPGAHLEVEELRF